MRRHARVDVLSIVTFNYWFRERDANSQIFLIDVHKYRIYDDKSAIIMPKSIVSDFNYGRDIEASIFAVELRSRDDCSQGGYCQSSDR